MSESQNDHKDLDTMLRRAYTSTEPPDSWEALHGRIDARLLTDRQPSDRSRRQLVFWRCSALALAAAVLVTTALLFHAPATREPARPVVSPPLLGDAQMARLTEAFAHLRDLFATQSPWLVIDSAGDSQLGISQSADMASDAGVRPVLVIRLALSDERAQAEPTYADLVTFPGEQIDLQMRTADGSTIDVRLVPRLHDDGPIAIHLTARSGDSAPADVTAGVGGDSFQPLVQLLAGTHRVKLCATARRAPRAGEV